MENTSPPTPPPTPTSTLLTSISSPISTSSPPSAPPPSPYKNTYLNSNEKPFSSQPFTHPAIESSLQSSNSLTSSSISLESQSTDSSSYIHKYKLKSINHLNDGIMDDRSDPCMQSISSDASTTENNVPNSKKRARPTCSTNHHVDQTNSVLIDNDIDDDNEDEMCHTQRMPKKIKFDVCFLCSKNCRSSFLIEMSNDQQEIWIKRRMPIYLPMTATSKRFDLRCCYSCYIKNIQTMNKHYSNRPLPTYTPIKYKECCICGRLGSGHTRSALHYNKYTRATHIGRSMCYIVSQVDSPIENNNVCDGCSVINRSLKTQLSIKFGLCFQAVRAVTLYGKDTHMNRTGASQDISKSPMQHLPTFSTSIASVLPCSSHHNDARVDPCNVSHTFHTIIPSATQSNGQYTSGITTRSITQSNVPYISNITTRSIAQSNIPYNFHAVARNNNNTQVIDPCATENRTILSTCPLKLNSNLIDSNAKIQQPQPCIYAVHEKGSYIQKRATIQSLRVLRTRLAYDALKQHKLGPMEQTIQFYHVDEAMYHQINAVYTLVLFRVDLASIQRVDPNAQMIDVTMVSPEE